MSSRQPNIRPRPTALFTMTDLSTPIIQAPMAGGPSTPDLAAAVSNAGGLGFLAAGYRSADQVAGDITAVRARTTGLFGVNFFVPQRSVGVDNDLRTYADELKGDAARYDTAVGEQRTDDGDWEGKLVVLEKMRPPVVSFTFGAPPAATTAKLQDAEIVRDGDRNHRRRSGHCHRPGGRRPVGTGSGSRRPPRHFRSRRRAGDETP